MDTLRETMLAVIAEHTRDDGGCSTSGVVETTARRLREAKIPFSPQALLDCWYGLFLSGFLCWGLDLANPGMNWAHVTAQGKRSLAVRSRAPENAAGYLAAIDAHVPIGTVARSYIEEALRTYNAGCSKATAVLAGAAAEALVLDLRDVIVTQMTAASITPPSQLTGWQIKTVRDAIEREVTTRKASLKRPLFERFETFWGLSEQLRITRNDVGHPKSVEPVTVDAVHASLLIFPEFAHLVADLRAWVPVGIA